MRIRRLVWCVLWVVLCAAQGQADEVSALHMAPYGQGEVAYLDVASGGVPLVFVHGWSCDMSFWDAQVGSLSREHRCLVIDLPGHGLSSAPELEYTQEYLAGAVLAVMDHAGVDRALLVGHSMGASVNRFAAIAAPDRVLGLIHVDGALMEAPADPEALASLNEMMAGFREGFLGPQGEAFTRDFIESLHSEETPGEVRAWVLEKMLATPERVRVSAMVHFLDPDAWDGPPVEAPTLALFVMSPDLPPDNETMMRHMFPNLTYELWDGPGHFLMQERPEELTEAIRGFVERIDGDR